MYFDSKCTLRLILVSWRYRAGNHCATFKPTIDLYRMSMKCCANLPPGPRALSYPIYKLYTQFLQIIQTWLGVIYVHMPVEKLVKTLSPSLDASSTPNSMSSPDGSISSKVSWKPGVVVVVQLTVWNLKYWIFRRKWARSSFDEMFFSENWNAAGKKKNSCFLSMEWKSLRGILSNWRKRWSNGGANVCPVGSDLCLLACFSHPPPFVLVCFAQTWFCSLIF